MSITMAITRPIWSRLLPGLGAALVLGVVGCSIYPAIPAEPAYDTDVLPIFHAHCTRCHDNGLDGGPNQIVIVADAALGPQVVGPPALAQFGPCLTSDGGAPRCGIGAAAYASLIHDYVHYPDSNPLRMPPSPAPPLDDWELKVIDAWTAQKPIPICSISANPDPALLCP
jgi:hypothetical protein